MQRREFLKTTTLGCCGTVIVSGILEKALGNNSIDNNSNEEAIQNFLRFDERDTKIDLYGYELSLIHI